MSSLHPVQKQSSKVISFMTEKEFNIAVRQHQVVQILHCAILRRNFSGIRILNKDHWQLPEEAERCGGKTNP